MLEQLIAKDVDSKPAVRKRLVSAILLGGNVLVKRGKGVGGNFQHIPACRSATQLGCVIAFSTFDQPPPANSLFGRTTVPGEQVLCTNPAALGGGAAKVDPIFPSAPFAPGHADRRRHRAAEDHPAHGADRRGSAEPGAYRAQCSSAGGANVLQITALGGAQTADAQPGPDLGAAPARRQHRARQPRLGGPQRGRRLRGAPVGAAGADARESPRARPPSARGDRQRPRRRGSAHVSAAVQSRTVTAVAQTRPARRGARSAEWRAPSPAGPVDPGTPIHDAADAWRFPAPLQSAALRAAAR